jgi:hypothetical protein
MKKAILTSICSLLFIFNISAQNKDDLEELKTRFESFNYSNVISIAEKMLEDKTRYSEDELIEIYLLKGISHYSLKQPEEVKSCFYEILKLDSDYKIEPSRVSPKIINEFEKAKNEYDQIVSHGESSVTVKTDTLYRVDTLMVGTDKEIYSSAMIRSIVLPGWGHLYAGHKTKGLVLTSVSAVTLGSMLYYIFDTNDKRTQYLNELEPDLIDQKYDEYNSSYKIRNVLIAAYAIVWIYAQLDLLFISEIPYVPEISNSAAVNLPHSYPADIQLNWRFRF